MAHDTTHRGRLRAAAAGKWLALLPLTAAALWLVALAVGGAAAQEALPAAARGGVVAVPAQIGPEAYGLYLVDPAHGTMCLYGWMPGSGTLKLLAARTYTFDTRLDEYNTQPLPREIKQLVERQQRLEDVGD